MPPDQLFCGTDEVLQCICFRWSAGRSNFFVENKLEREKNWTVSFPIPSWNPCNTAHKQAQNMLTIPTTKWYKRDDKLILVEKLTQPLTEQRNMTMVIFVEWKTETEHASGFHSRETFYMNVFM